LSILRALSTGSGQFKPDVSISVSKSDILISFKISAHMINVSGVFVFAEPVLLSQGL
jgi:hypothetical protein